MSVNSVPKRGEVWLINFDPQVGHEIRKCRPAVVVSLDAIGKLPLRIIVPVTEWDDRYAASPWLIRLHATAANGLSKDSAADSFQVKSLSLQRFVKKIGHLSKTVTDEISDGVALCIGFSPPVMEGDVEVNA